MILSLETLCPACEGSGMVPSPAWEIWRDANPNWNTLDEDGHIAGTTPFPNEPEELPCCDCEGHGKVLTEDGQVVATLVHRLLANHDAMLRFRDAAKPRQNGRWQNSITASSRNAGHGKIWNAP